MKEKIKNTLISNGVSAVAQVTTGTLVPSLIVVGITAGPFGWLALGGALLLDEAIFAAADDD